MNKDERDADAKFMAFAKRFKSQAKKVKVLSDDEDVTVVEDSKSSKKPLLSLPPLKPAKMYAPSGSKVTTTPKAAMETDDPVFVVKLEELDIKDLKILVSGKSTFVYMK